MQTTAIGTGTLTLEGGTLSSSSAGTDPSATTGRTINNNVVLNGGFSAGRDGEAGRIRFGVQTTTPGTTTLTGNSTINANFANVEMYQVVTDGAADFRITKTGLAILELTNNNSFAGVTVNEGSLAYSGSKNALGTGTLILNNGAIVGQKGGIGANTDLERTIDNSVRISGNVTFGTGSASFLGGNIDMDGGNRTLTLANSTHLIGDISNGTGLSVTRQTTDTTSSKTLSLYGNNSFTGGTTVMASADFSTNNPGLNLGSDTALGSGSLTFTGVGTNQVKATTKSESNLTRTIANNIVINNSAVEFGTVGAALGGSAAVSVNMALNGVISGGGALIKTNANTLTLGGANTYQGGTMVNGGALVVNGSVGAVTVNNGGSLGGTGTVGAVTLTSGSFLKPGNSPGLLTAASSSWAAGSTYNWEINDATGAAGTNWDLFSVTGALDMSALSSSAQMNLVLESLSIANYSTSLSYDWVIAKAGSFIGTGLADGADVTNLFNINTTAFNGGVLPNGGFKVEVGSTTGGLRTLNLLAVPEPSTGALLGFGLGGLVLTRLLRRKQS